MNFAKIFNTKDIQILVTADQSDEGNPEVRFSVKPDNQGVCSISMKFKDTEAGWDRQESVFNEITEEQAILAAKKILLQIRQLHA